MNLTDEIPTVHAVAPRALEGLNRRGNLKAKVVRVLMLDDNEDDFALVKIILGKSLVSTYELVWAPTEAAALEAINTQEFDVGLFDYKLGGTTGLEILRTLHAQQCDIPIILLTGSSGWVFRSTRLSRSSG